jgi:hypothetical protein
MPTLREAQIECDRHLQQMERLFTADCRLTFIMRKPGQPDCWILMTRDNLEELIADMPRMAAAELTGLKPGAPVSETILPKSETTAVKSETTDSLGVKETAKLLGVSCRTIYGWIRCDKLLIVPLAAPWRVTKASIVAFVKAHGMPMPDGLEAPAENRKS